jgi:hypothetical protein
LFKTSDGRFDAGDGKNGIISEPPEVGGYKDVNCGA